MSALFRKEVATQQQTQWLGKALLLKGWPLWITVSLTSLFMVLLLLFLIFANYTRRINVSAEVITQPYTINLFSPQQGVISKLLVKNGQRVKAGESLYQIDVSQISQSGNVSTSTLDAIYKQKQQLEDIVAQQRSNKAATLANLQQQLEQYQQAQIGLNKMLASAKDGLESMGKSLASYNDSLKKGLITSDQLNNQRYLYYQQQSSYQNLTAQVVQQSLQISNLQSQKVTKAAEFDNQISQSIYQQQGLDRELAEANARNLIMITAPTAGNISSLSVTPGQMVNTGDSLVQLVPDSEHAFYLVAWVPDASRPYVKLGETINVSYAAFPFQKYGQFPGTIISVASAPSTPKEMSGYVSAPRMSTGAVDGSYFKAIVALKRGTLSWHGQPLALSSGMQAETTLFLEKRPLYQWMLSPYYSLKKSITGPVE
ncbi:HlyD family secretion protein [Rouxiella badensis]|jgi:membrane fusion protein|uniref:Colicin V secretion protein CvaA n=1 Tax=Rouxiella badensis TaxID=1646377 RepID=A0A1X0WBQ2_9GAMM|nr:HlyD family secretion protein [Rouxiella badensis]MCC3703258.1 HlyD family secretion protein [Rouxiella badensis]MCC3718197.1 HlyD family secretion protein [Rouxiella badensis]MCC3727035.1 HlyD family secretion protein [Rouxiella badensis]MCC3731680.1 HlyD family secretion protein [Rouxiella badensis]MCC3738616.1 HlyD family secretion protein [Rouxiella badensis]